MAKHKRRYITGIHKSPKSKELIHFRSSWEFVVCLYLDDDPEVTEYAYEAVKIPYIANRKSGKVRHYYPDFLITYKSGKVVLAEVKRQNQVDNLKVVKKTEAGKTWAKENKAEFQLWTDKMILPLQKLYKLKLNPPVKRKKKRRKTGK